jgi:hypothetical protein
VCGVCGVWVCACACGACMCVCVCVCVCVGLLVGQLPSGAMTLRWNAWAAGVANPSPLPRTWSVRLNNELTLLIEPQPHGGSPHLEGPGMWHELPRRPLLRQRPSPHTKIILPWLLLLLLLVLDACASAKNEERQSTSTMGHVGCSDSEGDFLQEEVDEGTDKHTTIIVVVLSWCVSCVGDEGPSQKPKLCFSHRGKQKPQRRCQLHWHWQRNQPQCHCTFVRTNQPRTDWCQASRFEALERPLSLTIN